MRQHEYWECRNRKRDRERERERDLGYKLKGKEEEEEEWEKETYLHADVAHTLYTSVSCGFVRSEEFTIRFYLKW